MLVISAAGHTAFVDDLERTLALLNIVDLTPEQIANVLDTAKKVPSFQDIVVRDDLSQRELAKLAVRSALVSGVSFGSLCGMPSGSSGAM